MRKWLDPFDAFFSIQLVGNGSMEICEIGVYEGGFTITLLENLPNLYVTAVDPYPQLDNVKQLFLENLSTRNLLNRVELLPDYTKISNREFQLVHIDGEHSEFTVLRDLDFARKNLAPLGIVVIDDIWHPLFPGIISAAMKTIHASDFVPFLITRNKMYLCSESSYEIHFANALKLLEETGIPYSRGLKVGDVIGEEISTFSQDNCVKGYPQLVVESKTRFEQLILLGLATPKAGRNIIRAILPPVVHTFAKRVFRRN